MDSRKKLSLFEMLKVACLKPSEYKNLLQQSVGKLIGYVAILVLLTSFATYGVSMIGFVVGIGGFENLFTNRIPQFQLENGTLTMEHPIEFEIQGIRFVADASKEEVTKSDLSEEYYSEILISKHNMIMKNVLQQYEMKFNQTEGLTLNNEDLVLWIPYIYVTLAFSYAVLYGMSVVEFCFTAMMFILYAFMINLVYQAKMKKGDLIKVGIYSSTIGVLLVALNNGFHQIIPSILVWFVQITVTLMFIRMAIAKNSTLGMIKKS